MNPQAASEDDFGTITQINVPIYQPACRDSAGFCASFTNFIAHQGCRKHPLPVILFINVSSIHNWAIYHISGSNSREFFLLEINCCFLFICAEYVMFSYQACMVSGKFGDSATSDNTSKGQTWQPYVLSARIATFTAVFIYPKTVWTRLLLLWLFHLWMFSSCFFFFHKSFKALVCGQTQVTNPSVWHTQRFSPEC